MAFGTLLLLAMTCAAPLPEGGEGGNANIRVALVLTSGDGQLVTRLGAELRAQHFDVLEAPGLPFDIPPPQALEDVLRKTGAGAAIRVDATPELVRVWIANATTGKQIFREVVPEDYHLDRALVAMWAVELLRASGFAQTASTSGELAAGGGALPVARPGVALELAPVLSFSPGGISAAMQFMVGVHWQVRPHTGVEALLLLPTSPSRLQSAGGVALVSVAMASVGAFLHSGGESARWAAEAGAGAAISVVHASGEASDSTYSARSDTVVGGGPYLHLGLSLRTTPWLRVRADALAGASFPRPVVVLDQVRVAEWGRPWTATAIGAELFFP